MKRLKRIIGSLLYRLTERKNIEIKNQHRGTTKYFCHKNLIDSSNGMFCLAGFEYEIADRIKLSDINIAEYLTEIKNSKD